MVSAGLRRILVLLLLAGSLGLASPCHGDPSSDVADDRRLVIVGLQLGAIDVDLPHPEKPGESFGSRFRLGFQMGYDVTRRFAVDADLGFSFLGESDSLNAILEAQGRAPGAAYTLLDFGVGLVGRWPLGQGRWAPFVRASGGLVSLSLSWPDGGERQTDPAWSLGGGLEFALARPVLLRAQGRWLGQRSDGETANHATLELAVYYVMYQSLFGP
jgi:hypothetical protein